MTFLAFKIVGKVPDEKERLSKIVNSSDISFFINFKILIGILLGLEAL